MKIAFANKQLLALYVGQPTRLGLKLPAGVAERFRTRVVAMEAATSPDDLRAFTSWNLEALKGDRRGEHSIRLNRSYRLICRFERDGSVWVSEIREITNHYGD